MIPEDRRSAVQEAERPLAPRSGRAVVVAALLLLGSGVRCNTDHEQLAQRPGTATTSSTGTGGMGGNATVTSLTSTQTATSTSSGGTMHYPPDGADVLTLVHGQVDAQRIAFCLGRAADDGPTRFDTPPLPVGGLAYGEAFTLTEAEELDFENDDLELVVLAGAFPADVACSDFLEQAYWPGRIQTQDPGAAGAAGAADAAAGVAGAGVAGAGGAGAVERPWLRAMVLPTIPANSLVLGRHYVMVLAGCMGGPGVVDDGIHCGPNYAPEMPSLRPLLVPVSRHVEPGRLALQFLHASAATAQVDVQSVPARLGPGVQVYVASRVGFGVIAPKEPYSSYSSDGLGIPEGAEIVVYSGTAQEFRSAWVDVAGAVEITDERSYLAILLGPSLGTESAEGFNETRVTLFPTGLGGEE
ncbi:MAG TPA: hypothetical protein VFU02_16280 [Polyangiaceae bacterium]|nr:hypothetical protein [Polyangiaceae bacterium]